MMQILNYPEPSSSGQLLKFIKMTLFYRHFIPNFTQLIKILRKNASQQVDFKLNVDGRQAFNEIKNNLRNSPVLKPFDGECDISYDWSTSTFAVSTSRADTPDFVPVQHFSWPYDEAYHRP